MEEANLETSGKGFAMSQKKQGRQLKGGRWEGSRGAKEKTTEQETGQEGTEPRI